METKGMVALVTGGASGLGEATARLFVKCGARVSLLDLSEEAGQKVASDLGDAAIFCKADVTSEESVKAAIDRTTKQFGTIHAAVNCAGVGIPSKVLSKKGMMPLDQFSKVIQINLVGTMNVIRLAAEQINKNEPGEDGEKGVIINTASVAAYEGQIGQAAYSASKAGVIGLTLPVAREFASYGIRVVTIAPGLFETPMLASVKDDIREALGNSVPFPKRLGHPEEYAALAKHIIENRMLNGETIRLDGAIRMQPR